MNEAKLEYGSYLAMLIGKPESHICPTVTFQITDACNLRCTYCYQHFKSTHKMTLETGKKGIDTILQQWIDDKPDGFLNKNTQAIILDFIGGEPFLYPDLMDGIVSYFIQRCEEIDCPWLDYFEVNVCTNGLNYFTPEVQHFIQKYKNVLNINVSVDGIKEHHDMARIDLNGNGSFDRAFKAFKAVQREFGDVTTKITLVPETFHYLFDSVKFMVEQGIWEVNCNYAYEPIYTVEDGQNLYQQLKKLADYMIENKKDTYITILGDDIGFPMDELDQDNFCGGNGQMLCISPEGILYPCVRFAETSLTDKQRKTAILGNVEEGYLANEETKGNFDFLQSITRSSQSTDECMNCPVAKGCGWCTACNFELTGTPNKRLTNICNAHKARVLATDYYYNKRYLELGDCRPKRVYLPEEEALKFISKEEYDNLKLSEKAAFLKYFVEYCAQNPDFDWESYLLEDCEEK